MLHSILNLNPSHFVDWLNFKISSIHPFNLHFPRFHQLDDEGQLLIRRWPKKIVSLFADKSGRNKKTQEKNRWVIRPFT
jgi:hypothetical protein